MYEELEDRIFGAPGKWNLKRCINRDCLALWLDPMPTMEDISIAYATYYTHKDPVIRADSIIRKWYAHASRAYWRKKFGDGNLSFTERLLALLASIHPGKRSFLDFRAGYMPYRPGARLLEVGCGAGLKIKLLQELGWQVEGIDLDPAAVENAREKGLEVRQGTLEEQEYDVHFDAILLSHLLEHVHDPAGLLDRCHDLLTDSCLLVVVTPNAASLGHRIYKRNWRGLEPPRHLSMHTLRFLALLASKAGYTDITVRSTIRGAQDIFSASRAAKKGRSITVLDKRREACLLSMMQLLEFAFLKIKPDAGEEIVMFASK